MDELHVIVEADRILTPRLILRAWNAEDAPAAFEIYGDPRTARAIGMREPVAGLFEMRALLTHWDLQSSQRPLPQGAWAVEAVDDGRLLGGATLLPFGIGRPELVMGWHLRPDERGQGLAGQIGHALAHRAFVTSDVEEVFVAAPAHDVATLSVGRRLGMSAVDGLDWRHGGVHLVVLRMSRTDLHNIRPGMSLDGSYDPEGLGDW
jgi:RimJ/RimL family protein N-acetyltransferase